MLDNDLNALLKYMQGTYLNLWYNYTLPIFQSKAINDSDDFRINEKMIQMLWNKNHLLNDVLFDDQRKSYKILNPGTWNREPGPDFKSAKVITGQDTLSGDVEIHLQPEHWNNHGHQFDPAYDKVKLHVVWKNPNNKRTPAHIPVIELSSQLAVAEDKIWELQSSSNYSKSQIHPAVECAEQMNKISDETLQLTFRAAGLSRLQRKANQIRLLSTKYGFSHAIYLQLADAMGFKSNREPFKQICERLPLETLVNLSPIEQKACLWGTSQLLPDHTQTEVHEEILVECKILWETWWRLRNEASEPLKWVKASSRPANSPERRMAAFIQLLNKVNYHPEGLILQSCKILLEGNSPRKFIEDQLHVESHWEAYCNFKTKIPKPMKLLGSNRKMDIIINVIVPAMAVYLSEPGHSNDLHKLYNFYCSLPKAQDNHILDIARHRFFIPPARMKDIITKAVDQQGVMQLMHDFDLPQTPEEIRGFWSELGIDFEITK